MSCRTGRGQVQLVQDRGAAEMQGCTSRTSNCSIWPSLTIDCVLIVPNLCCSASFSYRSQPSLSATHADNDNVHVIGSDQAHLAQVVSIYLQKLDLRSQMYRANSLVLELTFHRRIPRLVLSRLVSVRSVASLLTRSLCARRHGFANEGAFCRPLFLYVENPTS